MRGPIPASPLLGAGLKVFWEEKVVSRRNWGGFRLVLAEKTLSPHTGNRGMLPGLPPSG